MEDLIGSYSIKRQSERCIQRHRLQANGNTAYSATGNAAYSGTGYKPIATLHTEAMVIKEMLYILIVSVVQNDFQEHHPCQ